MTGSALNLALNLVFLCVELESMKHEVLRDDLVEVSRTQILFRIENNNMHGLSPCTLINEFVQRLFCESKTPRSFVTHQEFLGNDSFLAFKGIFPLCTKRE